MTLLISLIHKMYHPIKALAPLEVIVIQLRIGKLMSGHINTGTNWISCPDHSLIIFLLWGEYVVVSKAKSTEEMMPHTGLYLAGCPR